MYKTSKKYATYSKQYNKIFCFQTTVFKLVNNFPSKFITGLAENVVRFVFLPRDGAREKEIWRARVEYRLRIQRIRSSHQHATVASMFLFFWQKYFCKSMVHIQVLFFFQRSKIQ